MFDKSHAKILEELNGFEKLARSQTLTASLSKAKSLTESSYERMQNILNQKPQFTALLGKPPRQVLEAMKAYRELQDFQDAMAAIGAGEKRVGGQWRGSQAVLEDAERRGFQVSPDLRGLIQGLDGYFDETDRMLMEAGDAHRRSQRSQTEIQEKIRTLLTTGDLCVALAIATGDYLCYVLTLQIFDQQDSEFEQTLRNEGIWDVINLIIGAVPYVGLPASFAVTLKSLLERRTKRVTDADGLFLFLETYTALLDAWLLQADSQLRNGTELIQERA
jgi:hypothetical protein